MRKRPSVPVVPLSVEPVDSSLTGTLLTGCPDLSTTKPVTAIVFGSVWVMVVSFVTMPVVR